MTCRRTLPFPLDAWFPYRPSFCPTPFLTSDTICCPLLPCGPAVMEWRSSLSLPSSSPSMGHSILKGHCLLLLQGWLFCLTFGLQGRLSWGLCRSGDGSQPSLALLQLCPVPGKGQEQAPTLPTQGTPSLPLISLPHWRHCLPKAFSPMAWSLLQSWWAGEWHSYQMVVPLNPTKWCFWPQVLPTILFTVPSSKGSCLHHVLEKAEGRRQRECHGCHHIHYSRNLEAAGRKSQPESKSAEAGAGKGSALIVTDRNPGASPFLLLQLSCPLECSVLPGVPVGLCCSFADASRMQIGKGA